MNKKCKNKNCVDPCRDVICGNQAECKAEFHKGVCYCPRGLQGNPLVACQEVGCKSNDDCRDSEACDYVSGSRNSGKKECQPLCTRNPCARGATCTAANHKETCKCDYPLQGDGYSTCYESKTKFTFNTLYLSSVHGSDFNQIEKRFELKMISLFPVKTPIEPECRVDSDCPSKLACIGAQCQNPCEINNPCTASQECVVKDTIPSRSVACLCPDGTVSDDRGQCNRVTAVPECYTDNDCEIKEVCHQGSCIDACQLAECGTYAICVSNYHDHKCICPEGYLGNPQTECYPCE